MSEHHSRIAHEKAQKSGQIQQGPLACPQSGRHIEGSEPLERADMQPSISKPLRKAIRGSLKALLLPVLCQLPDISTVLLVRQECP